MVAISPEDRVDDRPRKTRGKSMDLKKSSLIHPRNIHSRDDHDGLMADAG